MDVERLKKMNNLAKTLKQQGLVGSQEEAAQFASKLVNRDTDTEIAAALKITKDQRMVVADAEPVREASSKSYEPQLSRSQVYTKDEINNVLQQFADQVTGEINKLTKHIEEQNKRIASLQELLAAAKATQREAPSSQREAPAREAQMTFVQDAAAPKRKDDASKETSSANPRSGAYSSHDVSIEKFFYFGTNK